MDFMQLLKDLLVYIQKWAKILVGRFKEIITWKDETSEEYSSVFPEQTEAE